MLDANYTRCLAHTQNGKANGCEKRDECARHVALRNGPGEHMNVNTRLCPKELDYFIPLSYGN